MKKIFDRFLSILPHINIALAVVMLTCFVIDQINRMMEFLDNDLTKWMLCVLCILIIIQSVMYIIFRRKK